LSLGSVFHKVRSLRKVGDPCSFLEEQLRGEWNPEELAVLRGELAGQLALSARLQEAAALLEAEAGREPKEPFHSILKVRYDGKFMYQALGVQARLSIELADWPMRLAEHFFYYDENLPLAKRHI